MYEVNSHQNEPIFTKMSYFFGQNDLLSHEMTYFHVEMMQISYVSFLKKSDLT